jgi:hypothetical protein
VGVETGARTAAGREAGEGEEVGEGPVERSVKQSSIPFPLVRGTALAAACDPPPPQPLPDCLLVPAPEGVLVLVPESLAGANEPPAGSVSRSEEPEPETEALARKDESFRRAVSRLRQASVPSTWRSETPFTDMASALDATGRDESVRRGLAQFMRDQRHLLGSFDTFFSAITMAATANWRTLPPPMRGVGARGWFIGRWLPTSLVVDGPVTRLLSSSAFKHAPPDAHQHLRSIRRFLQDPVVLQFRNALAHWSFTWESRSDGNYVVCHGARGNLALHQEEADAIHILTFAAIEVVHDRCLRSLRPAGE